MSLRSVPKRALAASSAMDLLGGSWVVLSRVIRRITIVITHINELKLVTPLISIHEPPSTVGPVSQNGREVKIEGRMPKTPTV